MSVEIVEAIDAGQIAAIRELFTEYSRGLGIDLCFQGFEDELRSLPGRYARPSGRMLLACVNGDAAGCVALRALGEDICEMKRLFLRTNFRGMNLGRRLAQRVIEEARDIGYRAMRLDTLGHMKEAIGLYRSLGFRDIPAYYDNPICGAVYLELRLS